MAGKVGLQSDIEPRLDRLPFARWHIKVIFALGLAWMLDSLEASIIGSVLGILQKLWAFTPLQGSLTVSVWLIGIMVGAVVFGYLADRYGRKPMFILTLLWYASFTVLAAFSVNIWMFIFARFMAAVGIGGEYSAISSAVVEFLPKRLRGRIDAFVMSMWPVGAIISAALVLSALRVFSPDIAWRAGLLVAVVLAAFALYIRRNLPESPRWLMDRGRGAEARAIVGQAEAEVMKSRKMKSLPAVEPVTIYPEKRSAWQDTRELFLKWPLRLFVGASLNFSQVALGYGSIAYAAVMLFPMTKTPAEVVPFYMMLAFGAAFLGGLTSTFMVDFVGRKVTGVISYLSYPFAAMSMMLVKTPLTALLSLALMQFSYTWGWVTEYVIKSEIFPTRVRAAGIGWCTFFGRLGGVIAPPLLAGVWEATNSPLAVSLTLAALISPGWIAASIWAKFGIEGRRKALEELVTEKR
jgi:MFS family permease